MSGNVIDLAQRDAENERETRELLGEIVHGVASTLDLRVEYLRVEPTIKGGYEVYFDAAIGPMTCKLRVDLGDDETLKYMQQLPPADFVHYVSAKVGATMEKAIRVMRERQLKEAANDGA